MSPVDIVVLSEVINRDQGPRALQPLGCGPVRVSAAFSIEVVTAVSSEVKGELFIFLALERCPEAVLVETVARMVRSIGNLAG